MKSDNVNLSAKNRALLKIAGNLAFVVLGMLCLVLAQKTPESTKDILVPLSAAILGVGLTGIISAQVDKGIDSDLFHYIHTIEGDRLLSNEDDLPFFRKEWHCYHVTVYKTAPVWVYTKLNLRLRSPGQLTGTTVHGPTGYTYQIKCFLRRSKFIMVHSPCGAPEALMSPSISIFPDVRSFGTFHSGFMQHIDYDGGQRIDPIMISEKPLVAGKAAGEFINEGSNEYRDLMKQWLDAAEIKDIRETFLKLIRSETEV